MKNLYAVTVEWMLKGEGEKPNKTTCHVVAETADVAVKAAVKAEREGFVEKLAYCRLSECQIVEIVDVIAA